MTVAIYTGPPQVAGPDLRSRILHEARHGKRQSIAGRWAERVMALVGLALLAVRRQPQIDSEPTGDVPRVQPRVVPMADVLSALVANLRSAGILPPSPPQGWRGWLLRARRWMRQWRDHDIATARLAMVREWCKTVALMAGTATFLYVCWALVDWIPA